MTYDSPFWTIEGEVISEVASFQEEVCWPQKVEKEKNKFWKYVRPPRVLNPGHLGEMPECWQLSRHFYQKE